MLGRNHELNQTVSDFENMEFSMLESFDKNCIEFVLENKLIYKLKHRCIVPAISEDDLK